MAYRLRKARARYLSPHPCLGVHQVPRLGLSDFCFTRARLLSSVAFAIGARTAISDAGPCWPSITPSLIGASDTSESDQACQGRQRRCIVSVPPAVLPAAHCKNQAAFPRPCTCTSRKAEQKVGASSGRPRPNIHILPTDAFPTVHNPPELPLAQLTASMHDLGPSASTWNWR